MQLAMDLIRKFMNLEQLTPIPILSKVKGHTAWIQSNELRFVCLMIKFVYFGYIGKLWEIFKTAQKL